MQSLRVLLPALFLVSCYCGLHVGCIYLQNIEIEEKDLSGTQLQVVSDSLRYFDRKVVSMKEHLIIT